MIQREQTQDRFASANSRRRLGPSLVLPIGTLLALGLSTSLSSAQVITEAVVVSELALNNYEKGCELLNGLPALQEAPSQQSFTAHYYHLLCLDAAGDRAAVRKKLAALLKVAPADEPASRQLQLWQHAEESYAAGRHEDAKVAFANVFKTRGYHWLGGKYLIAKSAEALGQLDEARRTYEAICSATALPANRLIETPPQEPKPLRYTDTEANRDARSAACKDWNRLTSPGSPPGDDPKPPAPPRPRLDLLLGAEILRYEGQSATVVDRNLLFHYSGTEPPYEEQQLCKEPAANCRLMRPFTGAYGGISAEVRVWLARGSIVDFGIGGRGVLPFTQAPVPPTGTLSLFVRVVPVEHFGLYAGIGLGSRNIGGQVSPPVTVLSDSGLLETTDPVTFWRSDFAGEGTLQAAYHFEVGALLAGGALVSFQDDAWAVGATFNLGWTLRIFD